MRVIALLLASTVFGCAHSASSTNQGTQPATVKRLGLDAKQAMAMLFDLEQKRAAADSYVDFFGHADAQVRARVALTCARIRDPSCVPALLQALLDSNAKVRAAAAFALGSQDSELPLFAADAKTESTLDDTWQREATAIRSRIENALVARLDVEHDVTVRQALFAAIGGIAIGPGVAALFDGLKRADSESQAAAMAYAIHVLRRSDQAIRSAAIEQQLVALAKNDVAETRFAAVYALARLRSSSASALFSEHLLHDSDARVRIWSARGLAANDKIDPALIDALNDSDWRVHVEALRSLGQFQQTLSASQQQRVIATAYTAVAQFMSTNGTSEPGRAYLAQMSLPLFAKPDELIALARTAQCGFAQNQPHQSMRTTSLCCDIAIEIASRTGDLGVINQCEPTSPDWKKKLRELQALSKHAQTETPVQTRLHAYVSDADPRVRAAAVQALAVADDVATRTLLRTRLETDTDASVLESVAERYTAWPKDGALADEIIRAIRRCGQNRHASMVSARQMLWRALAIHGWPANTAMIEEMAKKGPSKEQRAVREALGMRPIYGGDLELATRPHIDIENLVAKIHTSRGSFTISLLDDEAPGTVSNFVALARRGFYDGLSVHRVVPGFVIQAGDPRGDGFGGPGYNIACENSPRRYRRGVVGMALAGRDTGGSQFFITQAEHPHLDAAYTAFALVHDGMNVVDSLQIGDVIVAIEIFQAPTVQSQAHSQRHP